MLTLQQSHLTTDVPEIVYQAAHEVTSLEVDLLETAIRSAVACAQYRQGSPRDPVRKMMPVGVPMMLTACPLVMAPAWMMRLAWVPSSPSVPASKR